MERDSGRDSSLLAAHREEGVADGRAGSHPGHPEVGVLKAEHPADGTVRDHDPLDPTTKYFLNRFIYDFYSRRRATVAQNWSRSLRFLSTQLANASFRADSQNVALLAAGVARGELQVARVILRIQPNPQQPHSATGDHFVRRYRELFRAALEAVELSRACVRRSSRGRSAAALALGKHFELSSLRSRSCLELDIGGRFAGDRVRLAALTSRHPNAKRCAFCPCRNLPFCG